LAKIQLRPWLRAFHRDIGYVAVGLTFIYALSGLAVNHIAEWDPNYKTSHVTHQMGPLPEDEQEASRMVLQKLGVKEEPREVYKAGDEVSITFDRRTLTANVKTGAVVDDEQKPRFLLKVANWLHLNRGKKAWTYVADGYAAALLFLALSGIFMLGGKKGLIGRGAIFVGLGIAIPVVYVTLAG
jgi:hypothetical protein